MKNILVPTDFSDHSLIAARYALDLARHFGGKITLLYTYEIHQKAGALKSYSRYLEEDAHEDMVKLMEKLAPHAGNVKIKEQLSKGDAVTKICLIAERQNYDLIVMGTKGASGLKEVFIGSIAGGVIEATKTPVLVIPENFGYSPPELIVFAVAELQLSSSNVLQPLLKIVKAFESDLVVLHLAEEKTNDLGEILGHLDNVKHDVVYAFGEGKIDQRINNYISESDADMLCLIRRKHGLIDRLIGKSITLKQTFHTTVPLLVLKN